MEKFCVFCGEHPEEKNREHIIPHWLIELTGNPKRLARFGVDFKSTPPKMREFSFDAFTFPACSECNQDFSHLEEAVKPVVELLLSSRALSEADFIILFNWLDKVRVGLWLGYLYLDGNSVGISPSFHIATRMGAFDRTVAVFRTNSSRPRINFLGPESPCFQRTPTCFALFINNLCFVNTSGISSCSRRLGFPYARPRHLRDDGQLEVTIETGTERIMRPVHRELVFANAVVLHQPIFPVWFLSEKHKGVLDTDWVKNHSSEWERGRGSVFVEKRDSVTKYPQGDSLEWVPDGIWNLRDVYTRVPPFVYQRLIRDLRQAAEICEKRRRITVMQEITHLKRLHEAILLVNRKQVRAGLFDAGPANSKP